MGVRGENHFLHFLIDGKGHCASKKCSVDRWNHFGNSREKKSRIASSRRSLLVFGNSRQIERERLSRR